MNVGKCYLLLYNVVQFLGWFWILAITLMMLLSGRSNVQVYEAAAFALNTFQTLAFLEIVHSLAGLVRSPVVTAATQILSRLICTWVVAYGATSSRSSYGVIAFLLAWSITEIIRYSFYALGILGRVPYVLVWLRYTLFIVLYPLGAGGELVAIKASLSQVRDEKLMSLEMPNSANIAFSMYYALILFALMYLPLFPKLYFYMFSQRKKVLTIDASKKKD